ncbi:hypothetical protein NG799_02220 [Laspinema sp. D1]|uniref:Uncharacterized protein n=1 Tax=Laspinema palackyanum D2a TaxID=2953684 RepID=A0ABT2MK72_9CYAN|nr:hypothetical protein [Laspinema sp. D2a]
MKNASLDINEAIARMNRRETSQVQWTGTDGIVEWKYIKASEARNWDGSSNLNYDGDPNKKILQRKVTINGRSTFSNWW